jgi:E3 ubiquitin-protein ligase SHPRH
MSLIEDSVEEAVYNLSVSRRLQHIARQHQSTTESQSLVSAEFPEDDADVDMHDKGELRVESALDAANSAELQSVPVNKLIAKGGKGKGGGEVVSKDDLWTCLFSRTLAGTRANASVRAEMGRHERAEAAEQRLVERQAVGGAERA